MRADPHAGQRLDAWMPEFDVAARHETRVAASASRTYAAARRLDLRRSPLVRGLFALRALPGLLAGRRGRALGLDMEALLRSGFVLLEEQPGRELVLGLVGRFWRMDGGIVRVSAEAFGAFDAPGYARAAWNFTVAPAGEGTVRVATETRVRCTDAASRRRFLRYWRLVGPFSGLTRREMLRVVRRDAEAEA
jgi:hypothetical protein